MSPPPSVAPGSPDSGVALTSSALVGIRRLTALDTVRARIAMAVDLRLLSPGERLPSPDRIAVALDVSEITVRRALTSLARDGVLERRRGRNGGTLVAENPTLGRVVETAAYREATSEVHDLINQRILLECGVAHLAALSVTEPQVARLGALVEAMDAAQTWAEFHTADEQFHLTVAEATTIPSAAQHYGDVLQHLYQYFLPYPMDYLRASNREHRALLDALTAHDPLTAVTVAREHAEELRSSMFVGFATR